MAADRDVLGALTLVVAACDQALSELDDTDPPFPPALSEQIGALRDLVYRTLTSDRFRPAAAD